MKHYILGFFLALVCFGIGYKYRLIIEKREINKYGIVYPAQNMPMPEEYRMLTGYDSIEYHKFMGNVEVNFCFPNKWEFRKFKNVADSDHLVGDWPDTIMTARVIKPKKKRKNNIGIGGVGSLGSGIGNHNIAIGPNPLGDKYFNGNKWVDITPSTGSGMFMYHGENNPANDSLCKVYGHVDDVPWYDFDRTDPYACYRCKKHICEWHELKLEWEVDTVNGIIYIGDSSYHIPTVIDTNTTKAIK